MQNNTDKNLRVAEPIEDYAILLLDENGIILDWNKGAEKIKGYKAKEIIGKNFRVFYTAQDLENKLPEQLIAKAIAHGSATHEGFRVRKDGSIFWGSILITGLFDKTGRLTSFLKITRDLTEKKELEEKLLASEKQLRNVLENMMEGVQIIDFNWRYIYANDALSRYSYHTKEQLVGYTIMEKYPGVEQTELFKTLKQCMEERTAQQLETEFVFPDGSKKDFELRIQPVPEGIFILSVEITERKKADIKLRTSEETRRKIMNSALDAIVGMNTEGIITIWTPQSEKIFGWKEEEVLGKRLSEIIIPLQYRQRHEQGTKHYLQHRTGPVLNRITEITALHRNGNEFPVELTVVAVEQGGTEFFCAFIRDITERKKAEQTISDNEKRFRALIENSTDGLTVINAAGVVIDMSPSCKRILGYDRSEIVGKVRPDLIHPDDRKIVMDGFTDVIKDPTQVKTIEYRHLMPDGSYKWLECSYNNLLDEAYINAIVLNYHDVTERKSALEKIKQSEENYRFLFNNNPAVIFIWDLETLKIIEANQSAEAIYGYTREEFLNMTLLDLRLEKDYEKIKAFANQILHNATPTVRRNWEHLKKDGEAMMMDVTSHYIIYKGRASVLAIAENITEKLIIEEELKRSYEDIRQLNAHLQTVREEERKRIGREIHDELGQQLTAIKMDTVWIDKQIPSETVGIKNKLQNIIELLDGSHESVRKILNELRPAVLDDTGLLDSLQWQGQQFTDSTGAIICFSSNQSNLKLPNETSTCIFRVYQESLTNVMRYAEAAKVLSSLNVVNDRIILTIEDDGKGFDPSMIKNKKSFGILGMKERVLSLNGKFDLISSPGKGTKIVITLPYDDTLAPRQ